MKGTGAAVISAGLEVCVHPEGFVYAVKVRRTSGDGHVDDALVQAARRWRYIPLVVDGKLVPFCHPIEINYLFNPDLQERWSAP
jgi:TonB family protein